MSNLEQTYIFVFLSSTSPNSFHPPILKFTSFMAQYRSHKRKIPKERRVGGWRVSVA